MGGHSHCIPRRAAVYEDRGGVHRPRRVVGRGGDKHEEAEYAGEYEAATERLHVRLVAQAVAQLHVHHADCKQAARHTGAVAQQQEQRQRPRANLCRLVEVGTELKGVVRAKGGGDEQQGD